MNCDICYHKDESTEKKCCLNICFPCEFRVSGRCYICNRDELNETMLCDLCDKEITLYNTYFCNMGLKKPNHNIIFCRQCGIVEDKYLIQFCSDKCEFEDYHHYLLSEFFQIRLQNPSFSIKKCLEKLE